MDKCININHQEFVQLAKEANINPLILKSKVGVWQEANDTDRFPTLKELGINSNQVNYNLKSTNILLSDKAKQIFEKGEKNKWSLEKILNELDIPKEQKQLLLDLGITDREQLALELASKYGFAVEVNIAKTNRIDSRDYSDPENYEYWYETPPNERGEIQNKELNTSYYSSLTVPGGTNYTENEISTPLIVPSIQSHAAFKTENGIGWFRSDEKQKNNSNPDVILPIGTSGSGKSTFIKSLPQENLVVIEPDAMRVEFTGNMNDKSKDKEIYIEAANRAIQAIKNGKQVVFDTTNLTKDKRLPFIEAIKKEIPNANIQYKLMELNPELAKQRIKAQLARGENRANVSDETIDRHAESYKQMLEDIKNEPISPFIDGKSKTRRILEIQSDWGQKQRKQPDPNMMINFNETKFLQDLQYAGDLKIECD